MVLPFQRLPPAPAAVNQTTLHPQHAREALESAVKTVESALQSDSSYPQLVELFMTYGSLPSESGLHDLDYPADPLGAAAAAPAAPVRRIPLPAELTEQLSHMQTCCQMGLFPEIGRAWLSVDSDLFVWRYETGEDLAYFDGLSETILSVALVRPRPGVFRSHIHSLLCLATPVEVVLLGVSLQGKAGEELTLVPEPLFTVSSDGTAMVCIAGSATGRIFLGGRDGCLYEVSYSAGDGWFGRRCRKLNHSSSALSFLVPAFLSYPFFSEEDPLVQVVVDDSRQVLYTRSERGSLQVFDLGWPRGDQTSRVISVSQATLVQLAQAAARTVDVANFRPLVHIEAVTMMESLHVHLVAVTQAGVRLYFTTSSSQSPEARPSTLALVHVRLPPGFSSHAPLQRLSPVRAALCRRGTAVFVAGHSDDRDVLWTLSGDAFPFQPRLMETSTLMPLDGTTCCLAEATSDAAPQPLCAVNVQGGGVAPSEPPVVVTQHAERPRKFVLLSSSGCSIVEKPRPVDLLRGLLRKGANTEAVRSFFALHGEAQASATCLILACGPGDAMIAECATQALFLHGGEPKASCVEQQQPTSQPLQLQQQQPLHQTSAFGGFGGSQIWASTPYPTAHAPQGPPRGFSPLSPVGLPPNMNMSQQLAWRQAQPPPGGSPAPAVAPVADVVFSGRHDGCYLYFSRLVRPLWSLNLVTTAANQPDVLMSSVCGEDLFNYLGALNGLKTFLECTTDFAGAHVADNRNAMLDGAAVRSALSAEGAQLAEQARKKAQFEAASRERTSLAHLTRLVSHTVEVLGLWKVLCDHQFRTVSSTLPPELRDQLRGATLRELLLSDRQLTSALAGSLVRSYLDDNATTEAVSNRLRDVCPSLYRSEDALFTRAQEILLAARTERSPADRQRMLAEALELCKRVGPQLHLPTACGLLKACGHYAGAVDLCLSVAKRCDPQDLASHFYRRGEPADDERGRRVFAARAECYRAILELLSELRHPQQPSSDAARSDVDATTLYERTLSLALQSDDELFHSALYNWLCDSHQTDTLLDIRSPFLEGYLQRRAAAHPDAVTGADLLRKYHERSGNFTAAARISAKLADRHGQDLSLLQRLEYLSRAIVCMKSSEPRSSGGAREGDFLHQLEEKLDIARLQVRVQEALKRRSDLPGAGESAARLDTELFDVTRLYGDFAEPFDLAECKLAIVRTSGYDNPMLVENLWRSVLEREFRECCGRAAPLSRRLTELAREYAAAEKFFPLPFVVKFLELRGCHTDLSPGWPLEPLLEAGVSLGRLRDAYHGLYRGKDPAWFGRPLHLLKAIAYLVRVLLERRLRHIDGGPEELRRLANRCLDDIAGYVVDLQSMGREAEVVALMDTFKGLQASLEQFLTG